jgi:ABC-type multidrug transport system fused ATPase/permease subunit
MAIGSAFLTLERIPQSGGSAFLMSFSVLCKQTWSLLDSSEKRTAFVLLAFMVIAMFLETVGVGLVVPILAIFSGNRPSELEGSLIGRLFRGPNAIVQGAVVLFLVSLIKTLFMTYYVWYQSRWLAHLQEDLANRLFTRYMSQSWTFHLGRNSAQLIRNIAIDVTLFTNIVTYALNTCAESLVILGIALLLFWIEPLGTLVVATALGALTLLFLRSTQPYIASLGRDRHDAEGRRMQWLQQGLGGVKEIKLAGREETFIDQFRVQSDVIARVMKQQGVFLQLPRFWYELMAVSALCGLAAIMAAEGKPADSLVPKLGAFAAGAFRLLPSVNRLVTALQTLRHSEVVIANLYAETNLPQPPSSLARKQRMHFQSELRLDRVRFRYESSQTDVLREVHLVIERGKAVGLIGQSGAGKSTLVDIILGLVDPTSGVVTVDGKPMADIRGQWQSLIGYVPQSIYLCDDSVRGNVAFGLPSEEISDEKVWQALRAAKLDEFVESLPEGLETFVGERGIRLSGGQRQRVGIARAMYHQPEILVLDEATSSLDVMTETEVMAAIEALHGTKTLLIVAHRHSTLTACDVVYRMENGTVVASGRIENLASQGG